MYGELIDSLHARTHARRTAAGYGYRGRYVAQANQYHFSIVNIISESPSSCSPRRFF